MLTAKDLEKYHQAAERILNAMDNSPVPISWHEMDRIALQLRIDHAGPAQYEYVIEYGEKVE